MPPLEAYFASHPNLTSSTFQDYFSDFSLIKKHNPEVYDKAVEFWKNVIVETSRKGLLGENRCIIEGPERLSEKLEYLETEPTLDCVYVSNISKRIERLVMSKLILLNCFLFDFSFSARIT